MFRQTVVAIAFALLVTPVMASGPVAPDQRVISVQILDRNGYPLPAVTVYLDGGTLRTTALRTTDAQGRSSFAELSAGRYAVQAMLAGFTIETINVTLTSGQDPSVILKLAIDPDYPVIGCGVPVLDSRSSESIHRFALDIIQHLPIGRDPLSIITTAPGVTGALSA